MVFWLNKGRNEERRKNERWNKSEGFVTALLIKVGCEFWVKIKWTWNAKRDGIGTGDRDTPHYTTSALGRDKIIKVVD